MRKTTSSRKHENKRPLKTNRYKGSNLRSDYRRVVRVNDKTTPTWMVRIAMNDLQPDIDNAVCDGYGCYSRAKSELIVKVGPKKTISLALCESCKAKFNDHDTSDVMIQQQNSFSRASVD
jgi:hypothetical protein